MHLDPVDAILCHLHQFAVPCGARIFRLVPALEGQFRLKRRRNINPRRSQRATVARAGVVVDAVIVGPCIGFAGILIIRNSPKSRRQPIVGAGLDIIAEHIRSLLQPFKSRDRYAVYIPAFELVQNAVYRVEEKAELDRLKQLRQEREAIEVEIKFEEMISNPECELYCKCLDNMDDFNKKRYLNPIKRQGTAFKNAMRRMLQAQIDAGTEILDETK